LNQQASLLDVLIHYILTMLDDLHNEKITITKEGKIIQLVDIHPFSLSIMSHLMNRING